MSRFDSLRTPLKNARGLGSAKDGLHHFIAQRVSAIALIFLSVYFVGLVISFAGADYATARAVIAQPLHSLLISVFLVMMFWHGQLGLQVVIEDYVHTAWLAITAQLLIRFICLLAALASVYAVLRIALTAA